MRSAAERRLAVAIALACACGNLSNEDVAYLEAIPQRGALRLSVPAGASGQPACAIGPADVWTSARTTGDAINAGLDGILAMVETIRGFPPSTRAPDQRTWGPWPDQSHPGVQARRRHGIVSASQSSTAMCALIGCPSGIWGRAASCRWPVLGGRVDRLGGIFRR